MWLRNRRIELIILITELFLINIINIGLNKYPLFYNFKYLPTVAFIWILLNYIFGHYHNYFRNKFEYFLNHSVRTFLILLLFNLFLNYIYLNSLPIFNIDFYNAFIITIILTTNQYLIKKFLRDRRKIIFICDRIEYEYLKKIEKYENRIYINNYIDIAEIKDKMIDDISSSDLVVLSSLVKTDLLIRFKRIGINVQTFNKWCEENLYLTPIDTALDEKLMSTEDLVSLNKIENRIKKFGDISLSLFLIVVTLPFLILASILIKIEDKGPIFFSQTRTGFNTKDFKIYKLRTMSIDSQNYWAEFSDPRITKIGKILRKTHLDEIPQLLNVLKGEMSLIGPRPEIPSIEKKFLKDIKNYYYRYSVRPGLSGWAQVNYKYGNSIEDTKIKLSFDFYYIKNYSLMLDILILMKTIRQVLTAKGSVAKII